jgi:hypothetical protein
MADGMSDFTNLTTAILQIMVLMQFGLVVLNLSGMRSVPQCGSAWVLDSGPTHRGEQISAKMNLRHDKPRRYRALVLTSCYFNRISLPPAQTASVLLIEPDTSIAFFSRCFLAL